MLGDALRFTNSRISTHGSVVAWGSRVSGVCEIHALRVDSGLGVPSSFLKKSARCQLFAGLGDMHYYRGFFRGCRAGVLNALMSLRRGAPGWGSLSDSMAILYFLGLEYCMNMVVGLGARKDISERRSLTPFA